MFEPNRTTSDRSPRLLAGALAVAAVLAAAVFARAEGPSLLVPARPDSTSLAEPAPLLVPGQRTAAPEDTTAAGRLREAERQYLLARALQRQSQPVAAILAYTNAIKQNPQIADAHFQIGVLYAARERWREAAREYAAELVNHPDHLEAARHLGLAFANLGDTTRAIEHLERLANAHPDVADVWQALGYAYGTAGHLELAERSVRRALQVDVRDADAWRDLGVIQSKRGEFAGARQSYRRVTALAPGDAGVWVNLGNLEAREAHFDSALAAYVRAEQRDTTLGLAYAGQVRALEALGRAPEAAAVRRRWLKRNPDDDEARLEAIGAFAKLGRTDVAVEIARDGVRHKPKSGAAHAALGVALTSDAQWEAGLQSLRTAETLYGRPEQKQGVRDYIGSLRARAPERVRPLFVADSLAHSRPDSAGTGR